MDAIERMTDVHSKTRPRDFQRIRLYRAEREIAAFLRDPLPTIGEIQRYVDSILVAVGCKYDLAQASWLQSPFAADEDAAATATYFLSTISMPKCVAEQVHRHP